MRTLAVVNQKGGSGKTTTVVNLAAALAERKRRTLIVDMDPQASASHWYRVLEGGRGLLALLQNESTLGELVRETAVENLDIVPSTRWLLVADKLLAGVSGVETRLRSQLECRDLLPWDYILIDCPPNIGLLTINAMAAASELLIPVETHVLPLHGLRDLLETIELIQERLNPELVIAGILACRVNRRTRLAAEIVDDLRERFGERVFDVVITENVRLAECPSHGTSILHYSSRSQGARDYRTLAGEIIDQEAGK